MSKEQTDNRPATPGPWRYEASTKTIRSVPTNHWLATMDSWDGAVNHEANAKLIAAAPDMLTALRQIEDELTFFEAGKQNATATAEAMALLASIVLAKVQL